jgi:hypothetical protein
MADDGDPEHDEAGAPRDEADPDGSHDDSDRFSDLDFTSAFMLCAREPFENWVRGVEGHGRDWTLPPIARCSAYVTPELPRQVDADNWLHQNFAELFERQLEPWAADEAQWPADRSLETFLAWFDVVFSPTVGDMRDAELPVRPATCDPVSLRKVLAEFLQLPPDGLLYVDISTGELFTWTEDELMAIHAGGAESFGVPPEDMRELQEVFASESLAEIGHRADVDNPATMTAFVRTVESPTIRNRLMNALQSRKGPRRFSEALDVAGLRHRWSAWFEREAADTLRAFLQARGVPFVDDMMGNTQDQPLGE